MSRRTFLKVGEYVKNAKFFSVFCGNSTPHTKARPTPSYQALGHGAAAQSVREPGNRLMVSGPRGRASKQKIPNAPINPWASSKQELVVAVAAPGSRSHDPSDATKKRKLNKQERKPHPYVCLNCRSEDHKDVRDFLKSKAKEATSEAVESQTQVAEREMWKDEEMMQDTIIETPPCPAATSTQRSIKTFLEQEEKKTEEDDRLGKMQTDLDQILVMLGSLTIDAKKSDQIDTSPVMNKSARPLQQASNLEVTHPDIRIEIKLDQSHGSGRIYDREKYESFINGKNQLCAGIEVCKMKSAASHFESLVGFFSFCGADVGHLGHGRNLATQIFGADQVSQFASDVCQSWKNLKRLITFLSVTVEQATRTRRDFIKKFFVEESGIL
eukprot:gene18527-20387_t